MLQVGEAVHGGTRRPAMVGISRSAFYKYKDAVQPFQNMKAGPHHHAATHCCGTTPACCPTILTIFADSGANILTINQTIPTNGCAGVTVSAETSDMTEPHGRDDLRDLAAAEGVLRFEIMAG